MSVLCPADLIAIYNRFTDGYVLLSASAEIVVKLSSLKWGDSSKELNIVKKLSEMGLSHLTQKYIAAGELEDGRTWFAVQYVRAKKCKQVFQRRYLPMHEKNWIRTKITYVYPILEQIWLKMDERKSLPNSGERPHTDPIKNYIHGDLHSSHIILDDLNSYRLIDWSKARIDYVILDYFWEYFAKRNIDISPPNIQQFWGWVSNKIRYNDLPKTQKEEIQGALASYSRVAKRKLTIDEFRELIFEVKSERYEEDLT